MIQISLTENPVSLSRVLVHKTLLDKEAIIEWLSSAFFPLLDPKFVRGKGCFRVGSDEYKYQCLETDSRDSPKSISFSKYSISKYRIFYGLKKQFSSAQFLL